MISKNRRAPKARTVCVGRVLISTASTPANFLTSPKRPSIGTSSYRQLRIDGACLSCKSRDAPASRLAAWRISSRWICYRVAVGGLKRCLLRCSIGRLTCLKWQSVCTITSRRMLPRSSHKKPVMNLTCSIIRWKSPCGMRNSALITLSEIMSLKVRLVKNKRIQMRKTIPLTMTQGYAISFCGICLQARRCSGMS